MDQTFSWLKRKYEWASKREYETRRANQYNTQAAILDSISLLISNFTGQSGYESILMKPYEEAIEKAKGQLTKSASNDGIDTTQWWKK
ncbi:hypothetical protein [Enterococcus xiangfangensis]|uniref:Uncharacterized protein n=1 Tax=Enterococcus xiangfangensis TaxID=1296537 RepID=A0ABU3F9B7_9ENTE|nr:hypothetical protein [Enterococcus xiangfangensis]MDT2759267.1 hypothetical protein [Enterococcus xiangfangensis]